MYIPVLPAVTTGLRRGEILGLRWRDVDLEAGTLTVNQSLEYACGKGTGFKEPKTRKSRRTIRLPLLAIEALRRHRIAQFEQRQAMGDGYKDHGLVVARNNGEPMSPSSFTMAFASLVRKAGLPPTNFHSLRHGHISHLIAQKAPMKAISERAGFWRRWGGRFCA